VKGQRRVLVVDDELAIRRLLRTNLEGAGYHVLEAKNGAEGVREAASLRPELIILDLGLPDMSGQKVLEQIRQWSQVPILILTVQDGEEEKVKLLDSGADDFLVKPFGVSELLARLRVLERHGRGLEVEPVQRIGELEFDFPAHLVRLRGKEVKLTVTEYDFLKVLALHPGKVVTQRQILKEVWGPNAVEHSHYLRIYAAQLRKKIEDEPSNPKWIVTEPGVGYRLKD
jgi:two-component system KDP operon response regulator KdpE